MSNEKSCASTSINWYPGHMAKTVREITEIMKLIDISIVILDARIPYASLNKDIYDVIKSKTVIMVFNKSDLASVSSLKHAEEKYRSEGCYTVKTNSLTGEGIDSLIKLIKDLGHKIKYSKKTSNMYKNIKKVYRVLVVGIPNVGKSSVINKIAGKKSALVGNKPGVTKKKQWIKVGQDIELMDTPGLLAKNIASDNSSEKLAITGNIKDEVLDMEILALSLINILMANDVHAAMFKQRYALDKKIDTMKDYEILEEVGKSRGAIVQGGVVDISKAARLLIEDYRTGKIGKISLE